MVSTNDPIGRTAASEDVYAGRALDLATKALVLVVLAVGGGGLAGAKAHAEAGLKAGLTP
jgi:alkylhydroperoxidase/carboxymuconolactone decarboxylase family protein YurZ